MIVRTRRPLIDRPRYVPKPPNAVNTKNSNKPVNKKSSNKQQTKRKVTDKQMHMQMMQQKMQQPVSGSINKINETTKVKPPTKQNPPQKRKTKKLPTPPRKPKVTKEDRNGGGILKQMKDKFVGKPKDGGNN